ncbi:SPOR domain-containing protein [Pseudosulfitobacter pseudonitzschiae]|uniref:SPOR domain-containing protein n=1 Tax=Pseudosulfitobacter pseudonitzschiae TaxID=1402135 RepID=UPI001CCE7F59|nr:SPOR domain-containing protein [Pseudosulfitobacter pseudonitzschiae]MCA0135139.1 SPOR domain-containing protein [Pseudosulfitobacter pseudonitzschiae]MCD2326726.1 SPOR domain-containing protein [Pseudosulfitobacter pseudonitzschiae]MCD2351152.1 SPOR domain-containing protein [Pseudosulfitobacter pseudonitzschiae]MCI2216967.1 SPOR domain-containing protein [Pseudosulfitobacter pseudonitzschiae]UFE27871.1 SPOR domain-containing protein [Pseudosulfitobacter pseudonitzschiae]
MADVYDTHGLGEDSYVAQYGAAGNATAKSLTNMTNIAGAVVSLALIAGVGVWGYKLMVRDVSGIPVVRAVQGDMRVRPEEPGGQLAMNQGLAVNAVAADGGTQPPADRFVLAPRPVALADEDTPILASMVVPGVASAPQSNSSETGRAPGPDVAAALQSGSVDDLVNQLTDGVERIDEDGEADRLDGVASADTDEIMQPAPVLDMTGPGPKFSLRPKVRPADAPAMVIPARAVAVEATPTQEIDPESLATGTRLVQLGAFDSEEVARQQWTRIEGRFGDYLNGKSRIIQKAQSGGRTFYRLRAHGFTDLSDARRFCSALVAEGADCIPVVTR